MCPLGVEQKDSVKLKYVADSLLIFAQKKNYNNTVVILMQTICAKSSHNLVNLWNVTLGAASEPASGSCVCSTTS